MSQRSRRWSLSSGVALAAVWLICAPAVARGQGEANRSLLLFPIRSHWVAAPLAESVTSALEESLSQAGYAVTVARPEEPAMRLAVSEGWVEPDGLWSAPDVLAVVAGADAWLLGELKENEEAARLELRLRAAVSQQEASFEVAAFKPADQEHLASKLAVLAARATAALWGEIGADEEGRRAASVKRYAAGQAAMAEGMYRTAVVEFEAALMGEPDNRPYLQASAEARVRDGDAAGALVRMRRAARLAPSDGEVALRLGDVALMAGKPEEAEAAFRAAAELLPDDPRVVEGLARAARGQKQVARAEDYYRRLLAALPEVATVPSWLPGLLADSRDETIRLADVPAEEINRELGRLYLIEGQAAEGVAALLAYHAEGERAAYTDEEYLGMLPALDGESEEVARRSQGVFAAQALGQFSDEQADLEMEGLHDRSQRLATLAERMHVSARLDPAHRYRVLAYNLLNQSNFEALMYLRTRDAERQRRADLLRTASRKARAQANTLAEALLGTGAGE